MVLKVPNVNLNFELQFLQRTHPYIMIIPYGDFANKNAMLEWKWNEMKEQLLNDEFKQDKIHYLRVSIHGI